MRGLRHLVLQATKAELVRQSEAMSTQQSQAMDAAAKDLARTKAALQNIAGWDGQIHA